MVSRIGYLVLAMALLVPAAAAGQTSRSERAQRQLRYAEFLVRVERDHAAAVEEFRGALRIDRRLLAAHLGLASALGELSRNDEAEAALRKAARALPKSAAVWSALGQAQRRAGKRAAALRSFEKSVELDGTHAPGLIGAADLLLERLRSGEPELKEQVLGRYRAFLEHTGAGRGTDANRARRVVAQLSGGETAAALLDAKQLYERAFTSRRRMNVLLEQSFSRLEAVLKARPGDSEALYYRGLIHLSVKSSRLFDPARGVASLREAGEYPPALIALGRQLRIDDELAGAVAALARASELAPTSQSAWYELGVVRQLADQRPEAMLALRRAIDLDKSSGIAARAVVSLARLAPQDERVAGHLRSNRRFTGDVFDTEKFTGSVRVLEERLGGADPQAPEQVWLGTIMRRLVAASGASDRFVFRLKVVRSMTVNAFAVPNGTLYVTRGFLEFARKAFPELPLDASNPAIAAVLGHEIIHVTKEHVLRSFVFRDALSQNAQLRPEVLVSVTRTHEIESDREGMRLMFLAGYDPRWAVRLHEAYARELGEVAAGMDHPTFDERIHYLEEYWSNEMAFAYASFGQAVERIGEAQAAESKDLTLAAKLYREAIADLRRFTRAFERTKEAMSNLGLASTRLGVFSLIATVPDHPVARWYTEASVERRLALRFVPLVRLSTTRGAEDEASDAGGGDGGEEAPPPVLPPELREAQNYLRKAIELDPEYGRAHLNLAVVELVMGHLAPAEALLRQTLERCNAPNAERACEELIGRARNLLGIVLGETGRTGDAIRALRASIDAGPEPALPPRLFNLARALALAGETDEAIEAYERFSGAFEGEEDATWAVQARTALARLRAEE